MLDDDLLIAKPVLLAATAGSGRHALVIDDQMRPLFAYMRALTLPTSVFAGPEDWGASELGDRIGRAATQLTVLVRAQIERQVTDRQWSGYQHQFAGNATRAQQAAADPRLRFAAHATSSRRTALASGSPEPAIDTSSDRPTSKRLHPTTGDPSPFSTPLSTQSSAVGTDGANGVSGRNPGPVTPLPSAVFFAMLNATTSPMPGTMLRARSRFLLIAVLAVGLSACAGQATSGSSGTTAPRPTAPRPAPPSPLRSRPLYADQPGAPQRLPSLQNRTRASLPVLDPIEHAKRSVELVMYEDEDPQVDAALAADERRGVRVRVLLNGGYYRQGSSENQAAYAYLKAHRVPVRWTPSYFALTHQKTLVVDGTAYILTFNFTPAYYASSRDFGVADSNAQDVSAILQTFGADWTGRRNAAPDGMDLVWSPGSEPALLT